MRTTLFHIPETIGSWPLFGFGLLLVLWAIFCVGMLIAQARRHGWKADTFANLPVYLLVAAGIALVAPRLMEPGFGLPIRSYGLLVLIGVISAVWLAVYRARGVGLDEDFIFSLAFWLFAAGIAGARLFHVIQYWDNYRQFRPDKSLDFAATVGRIVNIPAGGLVVYGSIIGGALAMAWYVVRRKIPFLPVADIVAPCLMLGLAFGRIGCLMNSCCFGGPCTHAWAITFPPDSLPYARQLERGLLYGIQVGSLTVQDADGMRAVPVITWVHEDVARPGLQVGDQILRFDELDHPTADQVIQRLAAVDTSGIVMLKTSSSDQEAALTLLPQPARSIPVHPAQIYSAINALILCLLLSAYYRVRRRDGAVFALMLTLYPISRFVLEVIRTDELAVFGTGFSISQNLSILFLLFVVLLWWYVLRQPKDQVWTLARS